MRKNVEVTKQTAELTLPKLTGVFFSEDEDPIWRVRQLNGIEFFKLNQAEREQQTQIVKAVAEALATGGDKRGDLIKEMMGADGAMPSGLVYRVDAVLTGTVYPDVNRDDVLFLFENWPADAIQLANLVLKLTGDGADVGKPPPSTKPPASKSRSGSGKSKASASTS
jgi:hypothetical protein